MSKKLYNPRSVAPAVYIPAWLSQVSIKLLSLGAKMLYGRLSQWCNPQGVAYRSVPQLSNELGCKERTIEKYLKELKIAGLVGTYHPQAGGVNYYEFYDHEWMHVCIKKELSYENDPPHNHAVPPAQPCGTLPHTRADINININKRTKKNKTGALAPALENPFLKIFYKTIPSAPMIKDFARASQMLSELKTIWTELTGGSELTPESFGIYLSKFIQTKRDYVYGEYKSKKTGKMRRRGFFTFVNPRILRDFINNRIN